MTIPLLSEPHWTIIIFWDIFYIYDASGTYILHLPHYKKFIKTNLNEAQVELQKHSWNALVVQEKPSVLDLYLNCHLNKNKQEVLGRTISPTFPTKVIHLKCLNLIEWKLI
jgi:hypothetical protein